jgi:hypothetical protein
VLRVSGRDLKGEQVGHHRFAKINIQVNGKVKETAAAAKPPEPDENDVKAKIKAKLENLDLGGGYQLVDVDIKNYQKTPDNS